MLHPIHALYNCTAAVSKAVNVRALGDVDTLTNDTKQTKLFPEPLLTC